MVQTSSRRKHESKDDYMADLVNHVPIPGLFCNGVLSDKVDYAKYRYQITAEGLVRGNDDLSM